MPGSRSCVKRWSRLIANSRRKRSTSTMRNGWRIRPMRSSDSLTPAAEALGLQVQTTDWITRDPVRCPGRLDSPKVINAAFSDDVLIEGHNSELIEVGQQQAGRARCRA